MVPDSLRGHDVIPLCHFLTFFEVLALCSHLPKSSGIWFLTPFQHGASPCPHPRHLFSSDRSMSYNLFCTQPLSTSSFLVTFRCLSVHASWVFLRSTLLLSAPHTGDLLPISSNRPSWLVSEAYFSHSAGRPLSCPSPPTLQTARCATVATCCA